MILKGWYYYVIASEAKQSVDRGRSIEIFPNIILLTINGLLRHPSGVPRNDALIVNLQ
jgi:hypothetical protein